MVQRRVFISRNNDELSEIPGFAENERIVLVCMRMIELVPVHPLPDITGVDALFFSSPGAVKLFHEQTSYAALDLPVAAIGQGTAAALPDRIKPVFVGSGTTEDSVMAFLRKGWDGTLGVVQGERGEGVFERVAQGLATDAPYRPIVLYQNRPTPKAIEPCDAWAFTSPSNYRSFIEANPRPPAMRCAAIGNTTANAIGQGAHVAADYSEKGLWDAILSALRS